MDTEWRSIRLSRTESGFLLGGALAGCGWLSFFMLSNSQLGVSDWKTWVIAVYAVLSGIGVGESALLLLDRIRTGRCWRLSTMFSFSVGIGICLFSSIILLPGSFLRFGLNLTSTRIGVPGHQFVECAEGYFFQILPLLSLSMLCVGYIGQRSNKRWPRRLCGWRDLFAWCQLVAWSVVGAAVLLAAAVRSSE